MSRVVPTTRILSGAPDPLPGSLCEATRVRRVFNLPWNPRVPPEEPQLLVALRSLELIMPYCTSTFMTSDLIRGLVQYLSPQNLKD